jgi:hypothetical protein
MLNTPNKRYTLAIVLLVLALCFADNLMAQSGANMRFVWDSPADSVLTDAQNRSVYETAGHVQYMCQGIHTNTNENFPNAEPFVYVHVRFDQPIGWYNVAADSIEDFQDGIKIWCWDSTMNEEKVLRLLYYALTNYKTLMVHRQRSVRTGSSIWRESNETIQKILSGPCPPKVTEAIKTILK